LVDLLVKPKYNLGLNTKEQTVIKHSSKVVTQQVEHGFVKVNGEWERQEIPQVDLKFCDYDKNRRALIMSSDIIGMPQQFFVRSHHTGKIVRFVAIGPHDVLFDQDGWDGEQMIYRPTSEQKNVDHLVIRHET
jgi:hypothetical protein